MVPGLSCAKLHIAFADFHDFYPKTEVVPYSINERWARGWSRSLGG